MFKNVCLLANFSVKLIANYVKMNNKRVTLKLKHPNPLFAQWLSEWKEEATERGYKNQYTFSMALKSLQKYPLPFKSGRECFFLKGFSEALCKRLDDKLTQYIIDNPRIEIERSANEDENTNIPPKKKRLSYKEKIVDGNKDQLNTSPNKEYIPQHRTGPYAILLTLYKKHYESGGTQSIMTKADIIEHGQCLCDKSFTKPEAGSWYTAWSSMKNLLEKNLIIKKDNPPKFQLTEEGLSLATKLYIQFKVMEFEESEAANEITDPNPSCSKALLHGFESSNSHLPNNKAKMTTKVDSSSTSSTISRQASSNSVASNKTESSSSTFESVILSPNSFEIILLVDKQEVSGYGRNCNHQTEPLIAEIKKLNLPYEVRDLKVGDYTWICRDPLSNVELSVPYIIERKRMDDLAQSIKSGRYHEQKFRLNQCGIQNLIYLVENHGKNEHLGLPLPSLNQAAINTCLQDGFLLKFTNDIRGTAQYLSNLNNIITKCYKGKTVISCLKEDLKPIGFTSAAQDDLIFLMEFKEFNKASIKTKRFTVKDMFVRQLLQISGISVERALAIVEQYPTPKLLKLAYSELSVTEGERMLSSIQYGALNKNLGLANSKIIYHFFSKRTF